MLPNFALLNDLRHYGARSRRGKVEAMVSVKFSSAPLRRLSSARQLSPRICHNRCPSPTSRKLDGRRAAQGAWYLRGDIGVGVIERSQRGVSAKSAQHSNFSISHHRRWATPMFFMGGIGYEWNNWPRFDVTGEYRSKFPIDFFGTDTFGGTSSIRTRFPESWLSRQRLHRSRHLGLLDALCRRRPRRAWNKFADLTDIGIPTAGSGIGRDSSKCKFRLGAACRSGLQVTPNFTVEFAYRYLNYGSVTDTIDCTGGCNPDFI